MTKLIELVCTGNQGRSPVAELVANNYLHERGLQKEYQVISSGTMVDTIKRRELSPEFMKQIVEIARSRCGLQRDIYTPQELDELDHALRTGNPSDNTILKKYFQRASAEFVAEERTDRVEVLHLLGIEGLVKQSTEQTMARPDTIAVLSMARRNNDQVRDIYAGSTFTPIIAVLSQYVSGIDGDEIPNAFGLGREAYLKAVKAIRQQVPLAIDKVINEDNSNTPKRNMVDGEGGFHATGT